MHYADYRYKVPAWRNRAETAITARQSQVLWLIAAGLGVKAIACKLGISVRAVSAHVWALKERFRVNTLAGLVYATIYMGILPAAGEEADAIIQMGAAEGLGNE
jgi:DNA-binding NarL/FixJ family response regulator